VPGDHFTMMERYARHTAHVIDKWLNNRLPAVGVVEAGEVGVAPVGVVASSR